MNLKFSTLLIVFVLLLVACGGSAESVMEDSAASSEAGLQSMTYEEAEVELAVERDDIAMQTQVDSLPQERLIIRTANLSLIVDDTDDALRAITEMVGTNGGWVVSSNIHQYSEEKQGTITVRVPSTGFSSAIEAMKQLAVEVTNESVSGQDVTEEFVDLSLRLENLEATADRVRSFLDDATKVEDALAVNRELSQLEGEIELLKGRREFLAQSAQFSTITIDLMPNALNQPLEVAGWQPQGIAKEALEALIDALQGTGSFLIWLAIYMLPVALIYGVPIFFIGRWIYRWRQSRSVQASSQA